MLVKTWLLIACGTGFCAIIVECNFVYTSKTYVCHTVAFYFGYMFYLPVQFYINRYKRCIFDNQVTNFVHFSQNIKVQVITNFQSQIPDGKHVWNVKLYEP